MKVQIIILGVLVGIILKKILIKNVIYRGPNSKEIKKKIYIINNKKYKLVPNLVPCLNQHI